MLEKKCELVFYAMLNLKKGNIFSSLLDKSNMTCNCTNILKAKQNTTWWEIIIWFKYVYFRRLFAVSRERRMLVQCLQVLHRKQRWHSWCHMGHPPPSPPSPPKWHPPPRKTLKYPNQLMCRNYSIDVFKV